MTTQFIMFVDDQSKSLSVNTINILHFAGDGEHFTVITVVMDTQTINQYRVEIPYDFVMHTIAQNPDVGVLNINTMWERSCGEKEEFVRELVGE